MKNRSAVSQQFYRMNFSLLLLSALLFLLSLTAVFYSLENRVNERFSEKELEIFDRDLRNKEELFKNTLNILGSMSELRESFGNSGKEKKIIRFLGRDYGFSPLIRGIFVVYNDSEEIFYKGKGDISFLENPKRKEWYAQAKVKGSIFLSSEYGSKGPEQTLLLTKGIQDEDGHFTAVIGITVNTLDLIKEISRSVPAEIRWIKNSDQSVLYISPRSSRSNFFREFFEKEIKSSRRKLSLRNPLLGDTKILFQKDPEVGFVHQIFLLGFIFLIFSILTLFLSYFWVDQKLGAPLQQLLKRTHSLKTGKIFLTDPVTPSAPRSKSNELHQLEKDLSSLALFLGGNIEKMASIVEMSLVHQKEVSRSTWDISSRLKEISKNDRQTRLQYDYLIEDLSEINEQTGKVKTEVTDLRDNTLRETTLLENVSRLLSDLKRESEVISLRISQSQGILEKLFRGIASGQNHIRGAGHRLSAEITEKIDLMTGMITMIHSYASQANILAVNAAIELTHNNTEQSREQFIPVTGEIKNLAENILSQSSGISQIMNEVSKAVAVSEEQYENTESVFKKIHRHVSEVGENITRLTEYSSQERRGRTALENKNREVRMMTDRTSLRLNKIAEKQKDLTMKNQQILLSSQKQSEIIEKGEEETKQIMNRTQEQLEHIRNLRETTLNLQKEIDLFQIQKDPGQRDGEED